MTEPEFETLLKVLHGGGDEDLAGIIVPYEITEGELAAIVNVILQRGYRTYGTDSYCATLAAEAAFNLIISKLDMAVYQIEQSVIDLLLKLAARIKIERAKTESEKGE